MEYELASHQLTKRHLPLLMRLHTLERRPTHSLACCTTSWGPTAWERHTKSSADNNIVTSYWQIHDAIPSLVWPWGTAWHHYHHLI